MSGHSPRPVYTGGSIDAYLSTLQAWKNTPATTGTTPTTAATTPPSPPTPTLTSTGPSAAQQAQAIVLQRQNAEALARQQQKNALIIQQKEQAFQTQQLNLRFAEERRVRAAEREAERRANIKQLRIERQGVFADLMASGDQVRAVIFALGFGPENDVFDVRARQLGTSVRELKGARRLERTTEQALSRVLDREVDIGRQGVRGLGTAISSARAFVQGGADVQTLLTSAFGVGSLKKGEQPGISGARLAELIQEVVPQGIF